METKAKTYTTDHIGRVIIINLHKGDLLLEGIRDALNKLSVHNAVVVSGIGAMRKIRFHMITTTEDLPTNDYITVENPIELGCLQGLVIGGEPHLHLSAADHGKAYAGHLEEGTEVQYLSEIVAIELPELHLTRKPDAFGISFIEPKQQ